MKVQINNEYDKLHKVIVSSASYFNATSLAINNKIIITNSNYKRIQ